METADQYHEDVQKAAQAAADRTNEPFRDKTVVEDVEPDGLYDKYRVFREPQDDEGLGHPVPLAFGPTWTRPVTVKGSRIGEMEEVTDFVFVLKPGTDRHARVAIAAYAWSVMGEKPELGEDLLQVLNDH